MLPVATAYSSSDDKATVKYFGLMEPGVDFADEGKYIGRNDLLFVEKMM